jgi:UDP-2,4-diacetamido-2,4,6-trideoxy-beta-L-altropyranose hydrolase
MEPANPLIAIRVDASQQIGTGHVMRCLALAGAVRRRGGRTRFVSRHMPDYLRATIEADGHEFVPLAVREHEAGKDESPYSSWLGTTETADAGDALRALEGRNWDVLIVDHYALGAKWETALRRVSGRIFAIDDLANRAHDCDVLLDQNVCGAADRDYDAKVPTGCRLLFGPRYALLRDEFRELHEKIQARSGAVRRVLVFMGSVDAGDYTSQAIEALSSLGRDGLEVDVVIGRQHAHLARIERACAVQGYRCHVQTSSMAHLVAKADLAIGSGGSATWERCCLGLPTLTICVADNQRRLIESAAMHGLLYAATTKPGGTASLVHHLRALIDNPILLRSISANGRQRVDGRGTERVLRVLGVATIAIREATQADSGSILSWRNEPAVRAVSRHKDVIANESHDAWFSSVLRDPNRLILVGEREGAGVGVVRFDIEAAVAQVSIFLAPGLSGGGLGSELLSAAEVWLEGRRADVQTLQAEVLSENKSSESLFQAAGYQRQSAFYLKRLAGK